MSRDLSNREDPASPVRPSALLHRLKELSRRPLHFMLDGQSATAFEGDTVLTAVLTQRDRLGNNEFSAEARAGFCLMGACQDCWMRLDSGDSVRACSTMLQAGMTLHTQRGPE
jgi:predicted molibdopterin-dependent oxidoreductase YjgC